MGEFGVPGVAAGFPESASGPVGVAVAPGGEFCSMKAAICFSSFFKTL